MKMSWMTGAALVCWIMGAGMAARAEDAKTSPATPAAAAPAAQTKTPEAKTQPAKDATGVKGAKSATPAAPADTTASAKGTVVEFKTTEGAFKVELADKEAPISVKNFLTYVNEKFYDGTVFHRVVEKFVIQGGGYTVEGGKLKERPTRAPIANEAKNGLKNDRGTLAMARTSDPNSATAQFFVNLVDNSGLNYPRPDQHGYAVFGKVIEGMEVVDKIGAVATGVRDGMPNVPVADVRVLSAVVVKAASH